MSHALNLPPAMVETAAGLQDMVGRLGRYPVIAIDTESNSLFAYRERVCLVQLSTPETDYIVDTLALDDLSALAPVFSDTQTEKVFHGADYDIGAMRRDYGFEFNTIFDTMIASRTLGIKQFGLGNLLQERFGIELDKRMQRHNWGRRPLSAEELAYARLDSHYLLPLRDQLLTELRQQGREQEAREAFKRVTDSLWHRKPFSPDDVWRVKGALALEDPERGVLQALLIAREELACRLDWPPFKVLSDRTLVEIAQSRPTTTRQLKAVPGLSGRQIDRWGEAILDAVCAGVNAPLPRSGRPPRPARPDDDVLICYDRLRDWRKQRAEARGVEPDVLISNSQLMEIARAAPVNLEELRAVAIGDYQLDTYGEDLLEVLHRALGR